MTAQFTVKLWHLLCFFVLIINNIIFQIIIFFICLVGRQFCLGGIAPVAAVPAVYSVPYASSYSAHAINHAIAAPIAAPLVAAAPAYRVAPFTAYSNFPGRIVLGK